MFDNPSSRSVIHGATKELIVKHFMEKEIGRSHGARSYTHPFGPSLKTRCQFSGR